MTSSFLGLTFAYLCKVGHFIGYTCVHNALVAPQTVRDVMAAFFKPMEQPMCKGKDVRFISMSSDAGYLCYAMPCYAALRQV